MHVGFSFFFFRVGMGVKVTLTPYKMVDVTSQYYCTITSDGLIFKLLFFLIED